MLQRGPSNQPFAVSVQTPTSYGYYVSIPPVRVHGYDRRHLGPVELAFKMTGDSLGRFQVKKVGPVGKNFRIVGNVQQSLFALL